MKRSEINSIIREMESFAAKTGFALPPFTKWTPREWSGKGHEYDEIREHMLGWDITDYGSGDWGRRSVLPCHFAQWDPDGGENGKTYAGKIDHVKGGPAFSHAFSLE